MLVYGLAELGHADHPDLAQPPLQLDRILGIVLQSLAGENGRTKGWLVLLVVLDRLPGNHVNQGEVAGP